MQNVVGEFAQIFVHSSCKAQSNMTKIYTPPNGLYVVAWNVMDTHTQSSRRLASIYCLLHSLHANFAAKSFLVCNQEDKSIL